MLSCDAMKCCIIFFVFLFGGSVPLSSTGTAQITEASIKQNERIKGARGVLVSTTIDLTRDFPEDTVGVGKGSMSYKLHLSLFNDKGEPVQVGPGAGLHASRNGYFRSTTSVPGFYNPITKGQRIKLFIPYYAIDLPKGTHNLTYTIHATNPRGDTIGNQITGPIQLTRPQGKLFRITMDKVSVSEIAPNGEGWDLQLFSPKEKKPDILWRIKREGVTLFKTGKKKNTVVYVGNPREDRSPWFMACEGDWVWLEVVDHDVTSFWDIIGKWELDPWQQEPGSISNQFGSVTNAQLLLESKEPPQLIVSALRSSLQAREDGVSGFSIRFDYEIPNRSSQNRYFIDLNQNCTSRNSAVRAMKLVSGPVAIENGRFELSSRKGEVKLFLPYHGLCSTEGNSSPVRLRIHGDLDGDDYLLFSRKLDIKRNAYDLDDLEFGQFKIGQDDRKGQAGISLSCDYTLPEDYIRDHPDAVFQISADLRADHRSITVQTARIADKLSPDQELYVRNVNGRNPKGTLELFIPYTQLRPGLRTTTCGVELECVMLEAETIRTLGTYSVEQEINLPNLVGISLRVESASLRKSALSKATPNLRWLLWVGEEVVYMSPSVKGDYSPEWSHYTTAKTSVIDTDQIRITVVQDQENGKLIELGTWSGTLNQLPAEGDEEKVSVDGGVKMLIVRESY